MSFIQSCLHNHYVLDMAYDGRLKFSRYAAGIGSLFLIISRAERARRRGNDNSRSIINEASAGGRATPTLALDKRDGSTSSQCADASSA